MTDRSADGSTRLGYNRWGQALFVLIPVLAGAGLVWGWRLADPPTGSVEA